MRSARKSLKADEDDGLAVEKSSNSDFIVEASAGSLASLMKRIVPKNLKEKIKTAIEYANGKSDLVAAIVETQVDFYSSGFDLKVALPRQTSQESLKERLVELFDEHELEKIAEELIGDLAATENAILHWKIHEGQIEYIQTISPDRVDFDNSVGIETLKVFLSPEVEKRIKDGMRTNRKETEANFPKKYIDAAIKGKPVELKEEDGEYWVVCARTRKFNGLAEPSMMAVFGDIQLRELLISGDWSTAFFIKNLIHLIKHGEPITSGPKAGSKQNYATEKSVKKLMKMFQNPSQLLRLFVDHTVNIEYKHPDPEIFNPQKYLKCEERILRWGGVIDVLMTGKGDGFSQGSLGKNRFEARGRMVRKHVSWMFRKFLLDEKVSRILKVPKGSQVRVTWNNQNLKEWKEVHEGLKLLWDVGALDVETLLERLGENYDSVKERKTRDKKDKDIWQPLFEPKQGMLSPNGRPPKAGSKQTDDPPRPGRK